MKSDKAVVLLPQYLTFIDITQIIKCLPCADVNARAYLLPWDPNDERTGGGGGAPGRQEPDGEDGSTCVIKSCVESKKTLRICGIWQKNKRDDRQWWWCFVTPHTPGSDRCCAAPTSAF